MVRGERLSLRDVQVILGHAHLTTTEIYLQEDDHELIVRVSQYLAEREAAAAAPALLPVAAGYDTADMAVLFGTGGR
jgi:integrase